MMHPSRQAYVEEEEPEVSQSHPSILFNSYKGVYMVPQKHGFPNLGA